MCGLTNCTHQNNIGKLETSQAMDNSNQSLHIDIPVSILHVTAMNDVSRSLIITFPHIFSQAKLPLALSVPVTPTRRVSFHGTVQVMLIPCIQEYKEAKLFDSLWWGPRDFRTFQIDLSMSFKKFMLRTSCIDLKQALKLFILDELEGGSEPNQHLSRNTGLKRSMEPASLLISESMPLTKRAKV